MGNTAAVDQQLQTSYANTIFRPMDAKDPAPLAKAQKTKGFLLLKELKKCQSFKNWSNREVDEDDETAVGFAKWHVDQNKVVGWTNYNIGLLEVLRFAGIFEGCLVDSYNRTQAVMMGQKKFWPSETTATEADGSSAKTMDIEELRKCGTSADPSKFWFNGEKWIRAGPPRDGTWIGKSSEKPVRLLFVGKVKDSDTLMKEGNEKYPQQMAGWVQQYGQPQSALLILSAYDASAVKTVAECGNAEVIKFVTENMGLDAKTPFRLRAPQLFDLGASIVEQLSKDHNDDL